LSKYDEAIVEHLESDALEGIDPSTVGSFKRTYTTSGINGYRREKLEWENQRIGGWQSELFPHDEVIR
jgi:hypothetical protein